MPKNSGRIAAVRTFLYRLCDWYILVFTGLYQLHDSMELDLALMAVVPAVWQCYWLSSSAVGFLALLMYFWKCCRLFGSAASFFWFWELSGTASNLAVHSDVWKCCHLSICLSGSPVGYLVVILAIWWCCRLSGNAAGFLAVLLAIWWRWQLAGYSAGFLAMLLAIWQGYWLAGFPFQC